MAIQAQTKRALHDSLLVMNASPRRVHAAVRLGFVWAVALSVIAVVQGQGAGSKSAAPVNPDAAAIADFQKRVKEYVALHQKLEASLPKLSKEATPQEIDKNQRELGRLVGAARAGAKHGDLFTPAMQAIVRRLLAVQFAGPQGKKLRASIMDENPVGIKLSVNGRYPDTVPLSTMPPDVLKALPPIPEELEYRFIGDRLVLMDVHAHIIVDYVDKALPATSGH
jgi:hypothetical protein